MKCACFLVSFFLFTAMAGAGTGTEYLNRLPLRFEENRHREAHAGTRYIARARNFSVGLASTGNWLEWRGTDGKIARVETRLAGANAGARMEPLDRLPGAANYFLGPNSEWRSDVTGFGRIRCVGVYAGIDLVFHGAEQRLEYDFVVAPHADPGVIQMELSGQQDLRLDEKGELIVGTAAGEIRWKKPEIYQEVNGVRHSVEGRFVADERSVRFAVGAYDSTRELVIDPALKYATYLGAAGNEGGRGIGVDGAGNIYIAGNTNSSNLPTVSAAQSLFGGQTANFMNGDAFIAKFSAAGALVYLTYLGGSGDDAAAALAVDSAGNAYVVGCTTSTDFPLVNPYQARFGGMGGLSYIRSGDAFAAKLNPSGNKLLYSTYLGGSQDDAALAVAIDNSGNAYIAGATASMNFPVTAGAYQSIYRGSGGEPIRQNGFPGWDPGDAFIAKLDPTGSQLLFSTYFGGTDDDVAFSIAVDSANNIYIGGCTLSVDFPTTAGALQRTFGGVEAQNVFLNLGDGFVAKFNPTASAVMYSTYFGAEGDDCVSSIAVDSTGSVYMTGSTSSMFLKTTPNAFQPLYSGYTLLPFLIEQLFGDAFVAKLNPAGSALTYLSYLGGINNDGGMAIAVDGAGNAYVTGFTDSANFPLAGNPQQSKLGGDGNFDPYILFGDAFLAEVNPTGTALLYSSFLGGNYDDIGGGLVLDGAGGVYLTGATASTTFPVSSNAAQSKYGGGVTAGSWVHGDAFYAALSGFGTGGGGPAISLVANAEGEAPTIAANMWVEVKGANLATTTRTWQASDFTGGQMPTSLSGSSVTMNGENAYVYYISPTQINVLTPSDLAAGAVQVVVNNGSGSSAAYAVQGAALSPSFFIFGSGPYIAATHVNGTLIGPATLYPGSTTPATGGETVVIYANGFGPVSPPVTPGSETQSGTLPAKLQILIANNPATVSFAGLISPGLYQFNVTIPVGTPAGDDYIVANYNGSSTGLGAKITVQ